MDGATRPNHGNNYPLQPYNFFSPLGKLADRAICFTFRFFFLNSSNLSHALLDLFSRVFHQMEDNCVNVVNPGQFFDSSRDFAMATNFGQNWRNDLHSAPWHFKTELNIAIWIMSFIAQMIPYIVYKYGELWSSNARD